jgi:hypothetical protein
MAYRATSYRAGGLRLRVGEVCPPLDAVLAAGGWQGAAFLTAFNPGSVLLSDAENRRRQAELAAAVAGWSCLPGEGVGDADDWPPEPSLLVLGVSATEADALARRFGQAAWVWYPIGGPAELRWP